jgi:hypothetical protein
VAELTRERIDAEHFVARYSRGSLNEQEAEQFEEYCLLRPDVVRDVGADRALRHALKSIHSRDAGRSRRVKWRQLAIAASLVVVAVAIGWQFRPVAGPTGALYATTRELPADLREHFAGPFAVVRSRGGNVQTLAIPAGAISARLEIELPRVPASAGTQLALEELVGESWVARGRIEVDPAATAASSAIPVVIDLRVVRGPRVRLTLLGAGGASDAFELQLERSR